MENVTFCFPSCCSLALTLGLMTKLYEVIIALTNFWVDNLLQRGFHSKHFTTWQDDKVLSICCRLRKDWVQAATADQNSLTGHSPGCYLACCCRGECFTKKKKLEVISRHYNPGGNHSPIKLNKMAPLRLKLSITPRSQHKYGEGDAGELENVWCE